MSQSRPVIHVILASVREVRLGAAIADWVMTQARTQTGLSVELVDLKDHPLPLFDEPHHPRSGKYTRETTKNWSAKVSEADGFVFITPEYNHAYPASLKNALDHLSAEWSGKPVGFVSYGGVAAGTRAVEALLPVIACFEMKPIMQQVNIPFVGAAVVDGVFRAGDVQVQAAEAMFASLGKALGAASD